MNIFILDPNPELAAIYHNDKHIVKMPLEMAQMLCTNIYYLNDLTSKAKANKNLELVYKIFKDFPPPKSSPYPFYLFAFPNNPCTIWLRESQANMKWGLELFRQLLIEYTFRYEKHRDLEKVYFWIRDNFPYDKIKKIELTPFVQALPETYKDEDAVKAYRSYYLNDKRHIAKWKNRDQPEWWK